MAMPDDVKITAPSPPSSPVKRGRGRSWHEARKLAEQHRSALVGAVVLIHASTDEDFRRQLAVVLRMAVTLRADVRSKGDRAALSELAVELESVKSRAIVTP
jgi:hypothetical protein